MPNLRKALITVFATGTVLATLAAPHALAATHTPAAAVQHASARQVAAGEYASTSVTAAPAKVHRAACTSLTFNVYHDHALRPLCYAGTGAIKPDIKAVREITTGQYWGCLVARAWRNGLLPWFQATYDSQAPVARRADVLPAGPAPGCVPWITAAVPHGMSRSRRRARERHSGKYSLPRR